LKPKTGLTPNECRDMPQENHHQQSSTESFQQSSRQSFGKNAVGIHRRAVLSAGAAAAVLAGSRTSFAQNQPPDASAPTSQAAMPDAVKVDRLEGSILLIGIDRQESNLPWPLMAA